MTDHAPSAHETKQARWIEGEIEALLRKPDLTPGANGIIACYLFGQFLKMAERGLVPMAILRTFRDGLAALVAHVESRF